MGRDCCWAFFSFEKRNPLNFAQLRAFHAVAETGSFTAASEKLCLTQPAITLQVKALQQGHGLTLLYRRGRSMQLTEVGKELYTLTQRLFSVVRETDEYLSMIDTLDQGHCTVGADSPCHVMNLVAEFRRAYPGVTVSITLGNTEEVRDSILGYQSDLAIVSQIEQHPRIARLPLFASPLLILVSKRHPWASRRSITMSELDGITMIRRETGSVTRSRFEQALRESQISPKFIVEVDTREAVREAVAQNIGISAVQESEIGQDMRLHSLAISDKHIMIQEYIVFLKERENSRIVSALIKLVEAEVSWS